MFILGYGKPYYNGFKSTIKLILMSKNVLGFSNDNYTREIENFHEKDFEELKQYFATEELTKTQIGKPNQFINMNLLAS